MFFPLGQFIEKIFTHNPLPNQVSLCVLVRLSCATTQSLDCSFLAIEDPLLSCQSPSLTLYHTCVSRFHPTNAARFAFCRWKESRASGSFLFPMLLLFLPLSWKQRGMHKSLNNLSFT